MAMLVTPGQWGDAPQMIEVLERIRVARPQGGHPRTRPDRLGGDKAYSSRRNPRCLRRRQIKHTIPEPKDQRANRKRRGNKGGLPTSFDSEAYKRRNERRDTRWTRRRTRRTSGASRARARAGHQVVGAVSISTITFVVAREEVLALRKGPGDRVIDRGDR